MSTANSTYLLTVEGAQAASESVEHQNYDMVRKKSQAFATLNFTNSILGAGIMGLPFAMLQSGVVLGALLLVFVTVITDYSVVLLLKCARLAGANSYPELMYKTFGSTGYFVCGMFQAVFAFGGMLVYQIIITDNLSRVSSTVLSADSLLANRTFILLSTTLLIIVPLSLGRDLRFLGKTSLVSLVTLAFILAAVLIEAFLPATPRSAGALVYFNSGWITSIGIISFAFVCHHNSFMIYDSLAVSSLSEFAAVTHTSTILSLSASILLAIPAYVAFRSSTTANILNNFSDSNGFIGVARVLFAVTLFFTYPLDCFVAREVVQVCLFAESKDAKPTRLSNYTHVIITLMLCGMTTTLALMYKDLGQALQLTGGISASALAFVFPAACYIRLSKYSKPNFKKHACAWLLLVFGAAVGLLSILTAW